MKIRLALVSNSSTTSFCIYGIKLDSIFDKIMGSKSLKAKFLKMLDDDDLEKIDEAEDPDDKDDIMSEFFHDDPDGFVEELFGMEYFSNGYSHWLGAGIDKMKDDETKKQFQTRIKKVFTSLGFKAKDIAWIEESYYG